VDCAIIIYQTDVLMAMLILLMPTPRHEVVLLIKPNEVT
jgi:hypothetical protein